MQFLHTFFPVFSAVFHMISNTSHFICSGSEDMFQILINTEMMLVSTGFTEFMFVINVKNQMVYFECLILFSNSYFKLKNVEYNMLLLHALLSFDGMS